MIRRWLAGLAMVGVACGIAVAGEHEGAEPQLYWIYKEVVKPSMIGQYEQAAQDFVRTMNDAGVDAKCHYDIAIHQQDGYPWDVDVEISGSLENAEKNAASCVSLPMFPELKDDEVDYVIEKTLEWDKSQ